MKFIVEDKIFDSIENLSFLLDEFYGTNNNSVDEAVKELSEIMKGWS